MRREAGLTERQWEVFRLVKLDELGVRPAARRLDISPATVRGHLAAALKKLAAVKQ